MNPLSRTPRCDDRAASALPDAVARWWASWAGRLSCRRLVVGVSGGADSVALLYALHESAQVRGVELIAAHLDHGLRGAAGAADRRFVAALARKLRIRYRTARRSVPDLAKRSGLSVEMAAREVRYRFFRRVIQRTGAEAVAVGHTRDDQAETLLLRLARGTGPSGLGGMAPDSERPGLRIVRPLLDVGRAEVLAFLRARNAPWREDATNRDLSFQRNRVRLDLLPRIRRGINPAAVQAMARTARWIREEDRFLESLAMQAFDRCRTSEGEGLDAARLRELDPVLRRRVFRHWLMARGTPGDRMDASLLERADRLLARLDGSAWIPLPGGGRLERVYAECQVRRSRGSRVRPAEMPLAVPGVTEHPVLGWRIHAAWARGFRKIREEGLPANRAEAALSRARVTGVELVLRGWRAGDRIAPLGMKGSRKLQDILGEARIPRAERSRIPVLACGHEVVWLPGYRIARDWAVPTADAPALRLRAVSIPPATAGLECPAAPTGRGP